MNTYIKKGQNNFLESFYTFAGLGPEVDHVISSDTLHFTRGFLISPSGT